MKQYIRGYYCRDDMDLRLLNKESNKYILEALQDAYPLGLTAQELEKKTGKPVTTIYAQIEELEREHFIVKMDSKKQPKPRGRPSTKNESFEDTFARHRGEVVIEDSSGIYDTREGGKEGNFQLAPGNVLFSDNFVKLWDKLVEKADEEEISPVLMGFVEKVFRRAIDSNEPIIKSTTPQKNTQQCCYQCGVNHEARDFLRAISVYLIDSLQNSKVYVEFLKKNELLTEDAYKHALSKIERNNKREASRGDEHKLMLDMDKVERTLINFEKDRGVEQKKLLEGVNAVLTVAVPDWISKNRIMDNVDMSRSQLDLYLDAAVHGKFMEFSTGTRLYRTTEVGLVFLKNYKHLYG